MIIKRLLYVDQKIKSLLVHFLNVSKIYLRTEDNRIPFERKSKQEVINKWLLPIEKQRYAF